MKFWQCLNGNCINIEEIQKIEYFFLDDNSDNRPILSQVCLKNGDREDFLDIPRDFNVDHVQLMHKIVVCEYFNYSTKVFLDAFSVSEEIENFIRKKIEEEISRRKEKKASLQ